ncbi:twin-arginine translocase TatA/TatE family subunit [bacterium]|nr:twin-arginine translocase TatA/TatE family subunit [bacterium]MBU1920466.1 twin-arginine translocase TatA/TatE family subunit [bacterium]RQV99379.1 MAG: twin-arginine translocase TatA/TatE family subunit [bacterium]
MNLGPSEIFLVVLVILLLFGGKRLPEIARNLGRGIAEVRRYTIDVKHQLNSDITDSSPKSSNPSESTLKKTEQSSPKVDVNPTAQSRTSASKPDSTD